MCVHISIYVYTHKHTHTHTHTHTYIYIFIYIKQCIYLYVDSWSRWYSPNGAPQTRINQLNPLKQVKLLRPRLPARRQVVSDQQHRLREGSNNC